MENNKIPSRLTYTILSISLLTVMAGAAMAPALWAIEAHFSDKPALLVQFIVSLPALFIIVTNLLFGWLCSFMRTKTIAVTGLMLYVLAGAGAFFIDNISVILVLRALLGMSVGMIMPLSTGLLAYYYPPQEQSKLMGLCAAMNQLGGVIATLIAGVLAKAGWNYAFLVYLIGILILVPVLAFLPNEKLVSDRKGGNFLDNFKRFHPSVCGMLLLMVCFFVFPTNFLVICARTTSLDPITVTIIMVGLDVIAMFVGFLFGRLMHVCPRAMKYMAPSLFLIGYLCFALSQSVPMLLIGCVFIGIANGLGVPYINTIASIKAGRSAATTVMPLLSAALYCGQFISPLIVTPLSNMFFAGNPVGPYWIAVVFCAIFYAEMFLTRRFQALPED